MKTGLKEIIQENDGVKVAECRSKIAYNDNKETLQNFSITIESKCKSELFKKPVLIIKQN